MRKTLVAVLAVALCGALAAIAFAQTQTNTYTVKGSATTTKAGTKKKPVPAGIGFDFQVGEENNQRPAVVNKYSIRVNGMQVNTNVVPGCPKATIEKPEGVAGCPPKSVIGAGFIVNETGATSNTNDKSVMCNASVTVVNAGNRKAYLYIKGSPNSTDPRTKCAIELSAPIDANWVRRGNQTALEFAVPQTLRHPLPTLSNAVKQVTSKVQKRTKKIKGKTRGYIEFIGGCKNKKRLVTVQFTPESGPAATAQSSTKCK